MKTEEIIKALKHHGVIAFPTETVMGLGVLYDDFEAYKKLNFIKRRPEDKPYTMMLGNTKIIENYGVILNKYKKLVNKLMPGPVTILVKSKGIIPDYVTHSTGIIGIRVPGDEKLCKLLNEIQIPLLVPSANRSGEKPCLDSEEVKQVFGDDVDYIIEGASGCQKPSTIIDLTTENYTIIREGPISKELIDEILGEF